jgi:hypothetical protein
VAEQADQLEHRIKGGPQSDRQHSLLTLQKGLIVAKRSKQSTTHQGGVTSFDCMAMLPSMDRALHRSAEAMPLSASSLLGTQHRLPTQQPAAQMQPTAPPLPAISSTVVSPAANQQARQHLAASPHSCPLTNSRAQQTCNRGIPAAAHYAVLYDLTRLK